MRMLAAAFRHEWHARVIATLLLVATATAGGQARSMRAGAVSGTVKDSSGNPIPDVEVTALKIAKVVRTDTAGEFVIGGIPSGPTDLSFRRLAYSPVVRSVEVPVDDTTDLDVTLGVAAQQLTAVVVQADANRIRAMADFENRRKQGIGHFITRADIEARHPLELSDMMRMIPGAVLVPTGLGRVNLRFARAGPGNCPPQFFIDGVQANGFNIDDMPPGDVEGVEIYAGPGGLPPEFNRLHSTVACGAVLIWTRVPGQ